MKTDPRVESSQTHEALTTRRGFLKGTAATAGLLALGELGRVGTALSQTALPSPDASGIKHIVVVMMENRSFDHYLGWLPNADGRQKGLTYVDRAGVAHKTYELAPEYQGCGHPDPDHSYEGGRVEYNGGACDGWLRAGRERPIRDRLLHAEGSRTSSARRPNAWTVCRSLLLRHHGAHVPEPDLPARRTDGSDHQHASSSARFRRSGIGSRRPASRAATTSATSRSSRSGARSTCRLVPARFDRVSSPTRRRHAAARVLRRAALPRRRDRGSPTDDHPYADIRNGQAFLEQRLSRGDHEPGLASHAARVQLRRVGRLLRSRAAADGTDSFRRRAGGQ